MHTVEPRLPAPCHVFTPDWIAKQVRKYGSAPSHARPTLYHLWTSEECAADRSIIEQWVDYLPLAKGPKVISNLRKPEQFQEVYNELAVGDSLRQMGHEVEYEKELGNLTPDWFVRSAGTRSPFIVEVVSSMPPDRRARHDDAWDNFRRRLENESGNAVLHVQPAFMDGTEEPVLPPEPKRQKEIVRAVLRFLEECPPPGTGLQVDEMVIRFVGTQPGLQNVACGVSCLPFWVDGAPLKEAVREKVQKYRSVVQTERLPLAVCVVPDFGTAREFPDLQRAVLGEERCRLVQGDHGPPRQEYYRENNGLFATYPALSAATLVHVSGHRATHVVLHNPSATYPLDPSVFRQPATSADVV